MIPPLLMQKDGGEDVQNFVDMDMVRSKGESHKTFTLCIGKDLLDAVTVS